MGFNSHEIEKDNCWDCKHIIQGQSMTCSHPKGEQKYIYTFAYNTCTIDKWEQHNGGSQSERMELAAKENGWEKDGELDAEHNIQKYKPV